MSKRRAVIIPLILMVLSLILLFSKNASSSRKSSSDQVNTMSSQSDNDKGWTINQLKAIQIADQELVRHYPDKKIKDGVVYEIEGVSGFESIYTVLYSPQPVIFDRDIRITVDISSGSVLSYDQHVE